MFHLIWEGKKIAGKRKKERNQDECLKMSTYPNQIGYAHKLALDDVLHACELNFKPIFVIV